MSMYNTQDSMERDGDTVGLAVGSTNPLVIKLSGSQLKI